MHPRIDRYLYSVPYTKKRQTQHRLSCTDLLLFSPFSFLLPHDNVMMTSLVVRSDLMQRLAHKNIVDTLSAWANSANKKITNKFKVSFCCGGFCKYFWEFYKYFENFKIWNQNGIWVEAGSLQLLWRLWHLWVILHFFFFQWGSRHFGPRTIGSGPKMSRTFNSRVSQFATRCSKWLEPPGFLISIIFRTILPFELGL